MFPELHKWCVVSVIDSSSLWAHGLLYQFPTCLFCKLCVVPLHTVRTYAFLLPHIRPLLTHAASILNLEYDHNLNLHRCGLLPCTVCFTTLACHIPYLDLTLSPFAVLQIHVLSPTMNVLRSIPGMDKVLPDSSSTHRYENAKLVSWEDFLQGMGTGDILMHHGTGTNSRMMQKGMQCYYSHTCMVTRNPPEDVMALYEVKERCETGCYIWELTSQEAEHCRLIPFLPWLKHERTRNNEEYMLMWRKMNGLGRYSILQTGPKVIKFKTYMFMSHQEPADSGP